MSCAYAPPADNLKAVLQLMAGKWEFDIGRYQAGFAGAAVVWQAVREHSPESWCCAEKEVGWTCDVAH